LDKEEGKDKKGGKRMTRSTTPPASSGATPTSPSTGAGAASNAASPAQNNNGSSSRAGFGSGKMMAVRVHMLDDSITLFQVQVRPRNFAEKVSRFARALSQIIPPRLPILSLRIAACCSLTLSPSLTSPMD
jgi:hypothetical protein